MLLRAIELSILCKIIKKTGNEATSPCIITKGVYSHRVLFNCHTVSLGPGLFKFLLYHDYTNHIIPTIVLLAQLLVCQSINSP